MLSPILLLTLALFCINLTTTAADNECNVNPPRRLDSGSELRSPGTEGACSEGSFTMAAINRASAGLRKVPVEALFVSKPSPEYFGNVPNPLRGSKEREHWSEDNWLLSRFHFSFAENDEPPTNFGVLRVLNDDTVQPLRGFGAHGHQNMEIATIILQGELTHKDSMGTRETLSRGSIQFMSAGRGVRHSEQNTHPTLPVRFLQMWVKPNAMGLVPKYGSYHGESDEEYAKRKDTWFHAASNARLEDVHTPIKLSQDVNIFTAEPDAETILTFEVKKGRQAYFVQADGDSIIGKKSFRQGDAAEIFGPTTVSIKCERKKSFMVMVEMAYTGESRFDHDDDDE